MPNSSDVHSEHSEFRAAGLGHMRAKRGPAPKWRKHYGEIGTGFYESSNQVQLIPTQRAVDFILKHHLRIGEMLTEGVLFKDIWRAAESTKGCKVEYNTFYNVLRKFADFLDVPRKKQRKKLREEQLKVLADRLIAKRGGRRDRAAEVVVVEPAPQDETSANSPVDESLTPAQRRRRELLGSGQSIADQHNEQLAKALKHKP